MNINLTGNEVKIDLNNKNIGNIELALLNGVPFNNLEELNLSNNNISDINLIKEFNLKNLKKLDLSNNKFKNLKYIDSNNNIEVLLNDSNDEIKKVFEEINELIINNISNSNLSEESACIYNEYYNTLIFSTKNKKKENENKLLSKIDKLEKKILDYFNFKLNLKLTGKEIRIDLNNKNIGNVD